MRKRGDHQVTRRKAACPIFLKLGESFKSFFPPFHTKMLRQDELVQLHNYFLSDHVTAAFSFSERANNQQKASLCAAIRNSIYYYFASFSKS